VGRQHHSLAALPPGKDPVPIVQEVGWASGPVWMDPENLASTRYSSLGPFNTSLYRLHCPGRHICMYDTVSYTSNIVWRMWTLLIWCVHCNKTIRFVMSFVTVLHT